MCSDVVSQLLKPAFVVLLFVFLVVVLSLLCFVFVCLGDVNDVNVWVFD